MRLLNIGFFSILLCFSRALAETSREVRGDNYVNITQTLVGLDLQGLTVRPVGIGLFLGESYEIGLQSGQGQWTDGTGMGYYTSSSSGGGTSTSSIMVEAGEGDIQINYSAVYARMFLGNSFYFILKHAQTNWEGRALISDDDNWYYSEATVDMKVTTSVSSLGVGNQWTIGSFITIGADWFVYPIAKSHSLTYTTIDDPNSDPDELDNRMDKAANMFGTISGFQIVTFYIGITF